MVRGPTGDGVASILGRQRTYVDPLWRTSIELTELERRLLRTWTVRRLQFVAHAGAAATATHQTYSRLEHSLGLLSLVAHLDPDDRTARLAALLHDVGHLPMSHTFEGVAGLDHHTLTAAAVRDLAAEPDGAGIDAEEVLAVERGDRPSVLSAPPGVLKLDHFESFLRSGRAHGRLSENAPRTLARISVSAGSGVDAADDETARYIFGLAVDEADYLCSWENVVATGVVRGLVERLFVGSDRYGGDDALSKLIGPMTDGELWSVLLNDPTTRSDAELLRRDPLAWRVTQAPETAPDGFEYRVAHLYLDAPAVRERRTNHDDLARRVRGDTETTVWISRNT